MVKSILKGKITAINENGLYANLVVLEKNVEANITATYEVNSVTAGRILLTSNTPIFNTDNPVIWFNTDATHKHSVAQINAFECEICCFDDAGNLAIDTLQNSYFEVYVIVEEPAATVKPAYTNEQQSGIYQAKAILSSLGLTDEANSF